MTQQSDAFIFEVPLFNSSRESSEADVTLGGRIETDSVPSLRCVKTPGCLSDWLGFTM